MSAPNPVQRCTVHAHLDDPQVAGEWSQVVRGGPPQLSVRWLTCFEGSFDRPSSYAVTHGPDGQPDAVAVFHLRRPTDHHIKYRLTDQPVDPSVLPAGVADTSTVVVVAPSSYVCGLHVRPGLPAGRVAAAVDTLRRTVTAVAHAAGARTVLVPHLDPAASDWFTDALRFPMAPTAFLDLRGVTSFDDYVARLPGRRHRKIARERRVFTEAGLRIRTATTLDAPGLADRQDSHFRRYGLPVDPARTAAQFAAIAAHYRDDLLLVEALRGDETVGHVVAMREGDWVVPKLAAFQSRDSFAYFEAGYYATIEWVLTNTDARLIDYGGAAVDAKQRRGCSLRPLAGALLAVD